MRCNTEIVERGILRDVDLLDLGARSGLLWRSPAITIVGLGEPQRLPIDRSARGVDVGTALGQEIGGREPEPGTAAIGLTALPFDTAAPGELLIPPVTIVDRARDRFVTMSGAWSSSDVEREVERLLSITAVPNPTEIRLELERSADAWRDGVVREARDHLRATAMEKVVLARLLSLRANADFPISRIIVDLAERFPTAHLFAIDGFIGASPELLVSRAGRVVRAHPLAGTAVRLDDADADARCRDALLASTKDRTEHRITIDWLLAELLPFCSYVDAEPEPSIMTLANVHHLGTLVEGVLSAPAASVLELVAAVHPTPAVGGDPQADALRLIDRLEGFDRARYAGPAGWVDAAGNGEFAVSVRTAQVRGSAAHIAAGVGVVEQSDPEAELLETQAKFTAMLGSFLSPPD